MLKVPPLSVLAIKTGPQRNHSPEKEVAFSLEFTIRYSECGQNGSYILMKVKINF